MEDKKDFVLGDARKFGKDQVELALADMQEYFAGKATVDQKATANEEWWKLRHWNVIADNNEGKIDGKNVGSGWLFNSLINKQADIMDSFPKPNILPREADDEAEALILSNIVPTIMEHNDYENVYGIKARDITGDGTAITSVLWDQTKCDGLGDIAINNVDVHNIAWKPGVKNIQDSDKVYFARLMDVDVAKATWPELADKIGPQDTGTIIQYVHDDNVDTSNCVEVIDVYYKKPVLAPAELDGIDEQGMPTKKKILDIPKMVLHLAIIVGNQLAWCSENEDGYENGYYEHGKFPFVFAVRFPVKDSPCGFGDLDVMKNTQRDIDKLDQAILKNAMMKVRKRYWVKKNANIDPAKFADWNEELVEVAAGELGEAVRGIDVDDVPAGAMNHLSNKVEELKETSGNRDFSQGATTSGVTSGTAIAALQEAGSKLARRLNKELYRSYREEVYLVIELMRQFYTEPRTFRINAKAADALQKIDVYGQYEIQGAGDDYRFIQYSNAMILDDAVLPNGTVRHKRAMFDIKITAEKQSPFSRAAQNELIKELYSMGFFDPNNTLPARTALDAMDFEGKDKLMQEIEQNSVIMQKLEAAMNMVGQLSMMDPGIAQMAMQQGLIDPEQMEAMTAPPPQQRGGKEEGTPEERAARAARGGDNSLAAQARVAAANRSIPK